MKENGRKKTLRRQQGGVEWSNSHNHVSYVTVTIQVSLLTFATTTVASDGKNCFWAEKLSFVLWARFVYRNPVLCCVNREFYFESHKDRYKCLINRYHILVKLTIQ